MGGGETNVQPTSIIDHAARRVDWTLAAVLVGAFALRMAAIFFFPSLLHPDENFQLYEAAHRMAFGYGVATWEAEVGLRSPVIPYLLSRIYLVSEPVGGGPQGYIYASQIFLAALSLIGVAAVYGMGLRISRTHALVAGIVAAIWFEIVYFAHRPLTEAVAFNFLLVALALGTFVAKDITWWRLVLIGLCMGLTVMLRVQFLPAVIVLFVWLARLEFRAHWLPMILGGVVPVLGFGIADWIALGSPFHSYFTTVRINLFEGKASTFGTHPPFHYLEFVKRYWSFAAIPILGLAAIRARSMAVWLGVALVLIASHSLIPHKEYRFVFAATALVAIVAAVGSADLIAWGRARIKPQFGNFLVVIAIISWMALSTTLAFSSQFSSFWYRGRDLIASQFWLSAQPDLCGVAIFDRGRDYGDAAFDSGGMAFLHRNVRYGLYGHEPEKVRARSKLFNYIVLSRASIADFEPDYALVGCRNNVCIVKRDGTCN